MRLLIIALLVSLLAGQLGAITLGPGVTIYLHDMVVVLILAYGLVAGSMRRSRLTGPIAAFVLVGALSLLANPGDTLWKGSLYLVRWFAYAGVYIVLVQSKIATTLLLKGLFWLGSGFAFLGLLQFILYPDLRNLIYLGWDPHYYRVFSTLLDPNFGGIIFVLSLVVGIYLRQPTMLLVLLILALLLTYSRSSYLALLAAIAAWVVIEKKWKAGLFVGLIFLLLIVYLPRAGREALSLDRFDSTVARLQNWSETINRIKQKPLFGFGFNVLPFERMSPGLPSRAGAGIDNGFLFVGITTGIGGLLTYGWLLWSMSKLRKTVYLASVAALLVHSLFVNSLFYPWAMLWMWLLTAAVEKSSADT